MIGISGEESVEATRDPLPWLITNAEWDYEERHASEDEADLHSLQGDMVTFAPRREQFDTPGEVAGVWK